MTDRTCYVCERAIAPGARAVKELVSDQGEELGYAEVVLEVLRHPDCAPGGVRA